MWPPSQWQHLSQSARPPCKTASSWLILARWEEEGGGAQNPGERVERFHSEVWTSTSSVCSSLSQFTLFVLLCYVRQLCGQPTKVSLVQISCQLLPPSRVEGAGEGHFRGGGEAVFGLAPGTGLEKGEKRIQFLTCWYFRSKPVILCNKNTFSALLW